MKTLVISLVTATLLAGCATSDVRATDKEIRNKADYWQRADSTSALYLKGPKAQYQLNSDIASCVAEVKELVRLGSIRRASPPANIGMEPGLARGWDSPTRNGPLFTEYRDFSDFDGCMNHKGWVRTDYVRPATQDQAINNYKTTILGIDGVTSHGYDASPKSFND